MQFRAASLTAILIVGVGACADSPTAPESSPQLASHRPAPGTGLVLDNLTGITAPVVSLPLGEVVIDQAVITDLMLVEDIVSGLIGLQATGVLEAHGGVLGTDVVTQDFTTTLGITSSGPGQCEVVTLDVGEIDVDLLSPIVTVDVPATTVTGRGSGAVGSLLCNLGSLLNAPGRAARGIVQAINNII